MKVVPEEKMFENDDIHTYIHTQIRTSAACLSYKLTSEPSAQVSL